MTSATAAPTRPRPTRRRPLALELLQRPPSSPVGWDHGTGLVRNHRRTPASQPDGITALHDPEDLNWLANNPLITMQYTPTTSTYNYHHAHAATGNQPPASPLPNGVSNVQRQKQLVRPA